MKKRRILAAVLAFCMVSSVMLGAMPVAAHDATDGVISDQRANITYMYLGKTNAISVKPGMTETVFNPQTDWEAGKILWFGVRFSEMSRAAGADMFNAAATTANTTEQKVGGLSNLTLAYAYDSKYLSFDNYEAATMFDYVKDNYVNNGSQYLYMAASEEPPALTKNGSEEPFKLTTAVDDKTNGVGDTKEAYMKIGFNQSASALYKPATRRMFQNNSAGGAYAYENVDDKNVMMAVFGLAMVGATPPPAGTKIIQGMQSNSGIVIATNFAGDGAFAYASNRAASADANLKNKFNIVNSSKTAISDGVVNLFPNLYAVNFDLNTGTGTAPTALSGIKEGSAIDAAWPNMSVVIPPSGKVLTGWNTQADGKGTKVDAATVITAEMDGTTVDSAITLYAQYADGYSITFNGNGATTPATDTVYMVENTKGGGAAPTATRTGYTLAGWNEVANDATSTAYNSATAYNAAKTFYACWTANSATKATVTFNPVRTGATVAPTSIMINANDTIANLPTPTLAKYTFDGWYDSPNIATDVKLTSTTTFATDKTVYARWSTTATDKVTVNFYNDTYTQKPAQPDATITVNKDDNLGPNGEYMPVNPTKAGSGFDKWIVDANNDGKIEGEATVFDGKEAIAADTNVIAQWKPEVTVTFDNNYPSAPPAQEIKVPSGTAIDTLSTGKPTDPKRTGFKLLGWTKTVNGFTSTGECESIVTLASITAAASTETITYYAQWQYNDSAENIPDVPNTGSGAPQVLVTFQNNDGSAIKASGVPSGSTFEATYGVSLMPVAPARTGYTQSGWYNTATGEAWTSTTAVTAAVTVKPVWTAATSPFTVTFDNNFPPFKTAGADTNVLFTTLSVKSGETIGANYMPTAPARPGFTFAGWKTTATGATSNFTVGTTTITATTTLYAHWTGTVEATLTNQGNSAPMYNGNAIAASFTYQTVEGTSPSETKTAVMENTAQVLYQKDGAGAATATTPNAAGTYTVSFNVPGITFTYTPTDSYAIKPRDVKLTVTDQSKKVTTPETTLSATVAFTTLKNGAESDADIASLSIGDKHTETYKLWTDTTTNQGKIDDIELTVDTTRNAINKYVLDVALTDTNYKISSVVGTTWLQTDFTTTASYADAEKRVKFEIIPATVDIKFFADNAASVSEDKTITIDGGKSLTGANKTLPAAPATVPTDKEFGGWFINANPSVDDKWDVGDTAAFTVDTVVSVNTEVVAKWVASTNATGTITITGKTATDGTAPAVTLKKAGDYSETIAFDTTGKTTEYWSRVPNGTAKLVFDFTSTEAGSTIVISKDNVAVASFTIPQAGDVSLFANLAKTVALDVTIPAKPTNEIKIAVTPPAGEASKKTYTFHVQRLAEAKIELNPGNSPYGMIQRDNVTFTTEEAKVAAKTAFNNSHATNKRFVAGSVPVGGDVNVKYTTQAWGEGTEKAYGEVLGVNEYVNYDKVDTAVFVTMSTNFVDPGFTVTDSLGATIEVNAQNTVTRKITADIMTKYGVLGFTDTVTVGQVDTTTITTPSTDNVITFTGSNRIKPGIYEIEYTFTDSLGAIVTAKRPLIVLSKLGDVNMDTFVNGNDGTAINKNLEILLPSDETVGSEKAGRLFKYRITDVNKDTFANNNDGTAVNKNLEIALVCFYTDLLV